MVPCNPDILIVPPRTGMPSGVMGKIVTWNIVDRIKTAITYKINHFLAAQFHLAGLAFHRA
jgi:hypothetical protein